MENENDINDINNSEKINVRGIDFSNVTMDEAVRITEKFILSHKIAKTNKPYVIHTPNAEIVQACLDDISGDLFNIINSADMIIPDGAGVVLAAKILKTPLKQKVAGIELAYNLLPYLDSINGTLFLLGSKEDIVEKAANNLKEKYKNMKIFYNNGYFDMFESKSHDENMKVIEKINAANADVVFVCFGGQKQEKWMYANKAKLNAGLMIGLGGTIDDIAGVVKRTPKILIKLNLEWLDRLIKHPTRIGRHMALPKFVFGTFFAKKKNL